MVARGLVCTLPTGADWGDRLGCLGDEVTGTAKQLSGEEGALLCPLRAAYESQSETHVGFLLFLIVSSSERLKTALLWHRDGTCLGQEAWHTDASGRGRRREPGDTSTH